jgi:hypothetical protein
MVGAYLAYCSRGGEYRLFGFIHHIPVLDHLPQVSTSDRRDGQRYDCGPHVQRWMLQHRHYPAICSTTGHQRMYHDHPRHARLAALFPE